MVEEVLAPGQHIVGDPEVLEKTFRRELDHAVGGARCVADLGRVVDPAQIGVDAAGTPGMERDRLQLDPGSVGRSLAAGKVRWTH